MDFDPTDTPRHAYTFEPEPDYLPGDENTYLDDGIYICDIAPTEVSQLSVPIETAHIADILTNHEAPVCITEGAYPTFGDASDLPGADILQGVDWEQHTLPGHPALAIIPGHPECIVRIQNAFGVRPSDYGQLIETGVRHLGYLERNGIAIPAQRFFVAPDIRQDGSPEDQIYTVTEFIEGQELTFEPEYAAHAEHLIDTLATYQLQAFDNPHETSFLWDKGRPEQFTKTAGGSTYMHDVGLELTGIDGKIHYERFLFRTAAHNLRQWLDRLQLEMPPSLIRLLSIVRHSRQQEYRTGR